MHVLTFIAIVFCLIGISSAVTPVVLWHGMGDSCCNPLSMGAIKKLIEKNINGVYVKSLMIGNNIFEDMENGFLMNVNDQISDVCKQLKSDPKLQNGYHGLGFSQGGLFMRAIVQRCPSPPMLNLVSVGGPQQGVYGFPDCPGNNVTLCNLVRELLNLGAYISFVQDHVVQAEYWQDPMNEAEYRKYSVFLADINQENKMNPQYKANMMKLRNFVMVKFLGDTVVEPRESEWFGFYAPGNTKIILPLQKTQLYINDTLGIQAMAKAGKLHFLASPGNHLKFTEPWFLKNVLPFLK